MGGGEERCEKKTTCYFMRGQREISRRREDKKRYLQKEFQREKSRVLGGSQTGGRQTKRKIRIKHLIPGGEPRKVLLEGMICRRDEAHFFTN